MSASITSPKSAGINLLHLSQHQLRLALVTFHLLISFVCTSQTVYHVRVNFKTGVSKLSAQQEERIDSVLGLLKKNARNYDVSIVGHADSLGSAESNYRMSLKRASCGKAYLLSKGFSVYRITVSGRGLTEPLFTNMTEAGRTGNRRIEFTFREKAVVIKNIGGITLNKKRYVINAESGKVIKYASGTQISIPPNVFVDANGKAVKGKVEVSYQEYRDAIDFMLGDIPMNFHEHGEEQQFNSAGMFKLLAFQNGRPLSLKQGAAMNVQFAGTQKIPNLNFYRFDTLGRQWSELAQLTDANAVSRNPFRPVYWPSYLGGGSSGFAGNFCELNSSRNYFFLTDFGWQYANSNESMYAAIMRIDTAGALRKLEMQDSLSHISDSVFKKRAALEKKIKSKTHTYRTIIVASKRSKLEFKIQCHGREYNELKMFNDITWKCIIKDEKMLYKFGSNTWTECRISPAADNLYTILLQNDKASVKLHNVKLIVNANTDRNQKQSYVAEAFADYRVQSASYAAQLDELQTELAALTSVLDGLNDRLTAINYFRSTHAELYASIYRQNLYCFWNESRRSMSVTERGLRFERWLQYFDTHKAEMFSKYTSQRNSAAYQQYARQATMDVLNQEKRNLALCSSKTVDSLAQSLSVPVLGVYNVDALYKYNVRETLFASFKDERGKQLDPIAVFLVDKNVNSAFTFGNMKSDRSVFIAFNSQSKNTLVIIDMNDEAYLCNSNRFEATVKDIKKITDKNQQVFAMQKIGKMKSRAQLKKLLE